MDSKMWSFNIQQHVYASIECQVLDLLKVPMFFFSSFLSFRIRQLVKMLR